MKYLSSYVLSVLGGNNEPEVEDMEAIFKCIGADFDSQKAKDLISAVDGRDIVELINAGLKKMSSVPTGVAATAATTPTSTTPAAAKVEEKEAAKESSESEEEMGFGLFD